MGEMNMVNLVTCLFSLFEALNDAFEVYTIFSGLHFYTLSKTLISCIGPCNSDFLLLVETLLNNAFKRTVLSP